MNNLSKISIGIKTLLRDNKLFHAIAGIQRNLPEVKMIIADDGEMTVEKDVLYNNLLQQGHTIIGCPYDSGFGYKSNRIVEALQTDYLLIAADDFDFDPNYVREGIERMAEVLDNTDVDIASGRVKNHGAYEFNLEERPDGTVIEHPADIAGHGDFSPWFTYVDLTVNYNLVKRRVFEKVRWLDDACKIGGAEHSYFYIRAKREGFKTAYVHGVEIAEQQGLDSCRYRELRMRSNDPRRPYHDALGIKRYVLGAGQDDYNIL